MVFTLQGPMYPLLLTTTPGHLPLPAENSGPRHCVCWTQLEGA